MKRSFALALFVQHGYRAWMIRNKYIYGILIYVILLSGYGLPAQTGGRGMGAEDAWDIEDSDGNPLRGLDRKSSIFFHRPSKDTAVEQMSYASSLQEQGRLRAAAKAFNAVVHAWPDSAEAAAAQLAYARILRERGNREKAFREYQYLIEHYAGSFQHDAVLSEQLEIAKAIMDHRRGRFLFLPGFTNPKRAIPLFNVIIDNGPNWSAIPEIRLLIGQIYQESGDYVEAVSAYEDVIIHHGRHALAREAIFGKAVCLEKISRKNPRDEQKIRVALQALYAALREDLPSAQSDQAQMLAESLQAKRENLYYKQAAFYDREGQSAKAALLGYRDFLQRFPNSDKAEQVRERIRILEETTDKE